MTLLLLAACHPLGTMPAPEGARAEGERIAVTPAELDFGLVSVNDVGQRTSTFTVHNLGEGEVTVTGHDVPRGDDAWTVLAEPLLSLPAGAAADVEVVFTPATDAAYAAELVVEPGAEIVRLVGEGTAPVVALGEVEAEPVVLGCTGEGTVPVENRGREALAFAGVSSSSAEFEVVGWPDEIPPGGTDRVRFRFTPQGGGQRGGVLTIVTNDPLTPEAAVSLSLLGYEGERVEERFTYTPSNPTDILFLVDGGASMAEPLTRAPDGIQAFVDKLRDSNVDYQVAAVASGDPCPDDAPPFATRYDTSLRTVSVLERGFAAPGGAWDDDLLSLAAEALDGTVPDACLAGFRRPEADLHLIAVTDGPYAGDIPAQTLALAATWGTLRLSALVPADAGCGVEGDAWEEAVLTTGGVLADLCAEDWTAAFTAFATLPPGADPVRYPLAEVPVVSTLAVTVEGGKFELWSYDAAENAVVFDGDAVPALGAEVVITYVRAVACEE